MSVSRRELLAGTVSLLTAQCARRSARALSTDLRMAFVWEILHRQTAVRRSVLNSPALQAELETARIVGDMTTEQKVAQLFVVTPEQLLSGRTDDTVTSAGDLTAEALGERPVGGVIYFAANLVDGDQVRSMLTEVARIGCEEVGVAPLLVVDEEGGTVSRVGGSSGFDIKNVGNMSDVGARGDEDYARDIAAHVGSYLADLGFSVDFAPVADVANNPDSKTMALRSLGSDPQLVARMVAAQVQGFASQGILCCAKHFPGIGAAEGDSHDGSIWSHKTADEMAEVELVPFEAAIEAGVPMVMVGHLSCPEVTGSDLPASVRPEIMQGLLRDRLGFRGVVVTDSLSMGAIVDQFGRERVCVEAFLAGADVLLMPPDFDLAYQGMLDAVSSGEVSEERLEESVARIVRMKLSVR